MIYFIYGAAILFILYKMYGDVFRSNFSQAVKLGILKPKDSVFRPAIYLAVLAIGVTIAGWVGAMVFAHPDRSSDLADIANFVKGACEYSCIIGNASHFENLPNTHVIFLIIIYNLNIHASAICILSVYISHRGRIAQKIDTINNRVTWGNAASASLYVYIFCGGLIALFIMSISSINDGLSDIYFIRSKILVFYYVQSGLSPAVISICILIIDVITKHILHHLFSRQLEELPNDD